MKIILDFPDVQDHNRTLKNEQAIRFCANLLQRFALDIGHECYHGWGETWNLSLEEMAQQESAEELQRSPCPPHTNKGDI